MKYQFIILSLLSLTLAQATTTKSKGTIKALDAKSKTEVKNSAQSTSVDSKEVTSTPSTSTDSRNKIGSHDPKINIPINLNIKIPYWAIKLLPTNIQEKVKALVPKKSNNGDKGEEKSDEANSTPTKESNAKKESEEPNKSLITTPTTIADPTKTEKGSEPEADTKAEDSKQ